jgi:mannose-6-phosphate isomerase-like protein (cupin superfamily)
MFFSFPQDFKEKQFKPGAKNQFFWGDTVLITRVSIEPDRNFGIAIHPYEQLSVLLEGELEFLIGDEVRMLHKGDGVVIPPNTTHRARTYSTPAVLLECLGPASKEEFLA